MKLNLTKQNLDYDNIVTGKELDLVTYKHKIEMYDYAKSHGWCDKNDCRCSNSMNDDTLFCYSSFKDKEGNPFKYTAYQDAIANCHYNFQPMDPNRFILYKAANQTGKSAMLCLMAIKRAFTEKNINIVIVSRSLPQSQALQKEIRYFLNTSVFYKSWREDVGETDNTTVITFERDNGKVVNTIRCAPCGEGLLGYPIHYLYLDEFDFYEDGENFFFKIAYPRTNKTKGQIVCFSNPNADLSSESSVMYSLWQGPRSDLFRRKFTFNFLDAPWNTQEEYDRDKRSYPSYIFDSTHRGMFPPSGGGFFTNQEIDYMMQTDWSNRLPVVDRPVYIGLDLAKVKDSTVLSIGILRTNKEDKKISDLEVKYLQVVNTKVGYDIVIKRLKEIVDYYHEQFHGVARIGVDVSGVGEAVSDFAKSKGIKVTDVPFSLKNKSRMYGNFKMLAEQSRIKIVHNVECIKQLKGLVFKRTPSGYLSVHHEKEDVHDDYPDSICALIDVSVSPSKVPVTVQMVDRVDNSEELTPKLKPVDTRRIVEEQTIRANQPQRYGDEYEQFKNMGGGFGW